MEGRTAFAVWRTGRDRCEARRCLSRGGEFAITPGSDIKLYRTRVADEVAGR
jgi:hypothetical protein